MGRRSLGRRSLGGSTIDDRGLIIDGPATAKAIFILAHGAGAGMTSPFLQYFAQQLAENRVRVVRFEFPYMARARTTGKKGGPDRLPKLQESFASVVSENRRKHILIGGKSMGGRVASTVADELGVAGLVCLGYPFHPVGKPEKLRTEHLADLRTPALILQGERDTFGNQQEVANYKLSQSIDVRWLPDGDHSFKPRKSSGRTEQQNWDEAIANILDWISNL
ncbi:MAG: putative alpha/beta-hydrolase family hydrolase [Pirellulaceae bacterium]